MSVADRVKLLMNKQGMTQREFANLLAISAPRLNNYLMGKNNIPNDILTLIAKLTHSNLTWLLTGEGEMLLYNDRARERGAPMISIPVVADIAAGPGIEAEDLPPQELISISQDSLHLPGPYWAFRVSGISMEPELHAGDIAIVTRDWYSIDYRNRICAFRLQDGLVIKRLLMPAKSKTAYLLPINIAAPIITYNPDDPDIIMLGVLVAVLRKYN